MMGQLYSISIERLNHVSPKWSNRSSKMGHLEFSLGQWCAIVAYQNLGIKLCWIGHELPSFLLPGYYAIRYCMCTQILSMASYIGIYLPLQSFVFLHLKEYITVMTVARLLSIQVLRLR